MQREKLIDLVEASYGLDMDTQSWLDRLVALACDALQPPSGLLGYSYVRRDDGGVRVEAVSSRGREEIEPVRSGLQRIFDAAPQGALAPFHPPGVVCSTTSSIARSLGWDHGERMAPLLAVMQPGGHCDAWGLSAGNSDGHGVVLTAPLREPRSVAAREAQPWLRLGIHMAAAHRLRRRLGAGPLALDTADAVLDVEGRLLEARDGRAQCHSMRERLRHAVRALDEARCSGLRQRAPLTALELWQGLVAGRWSLVDHFDSDGRRFVVAHRNESRLPEPRQLTPRERQVLLGAALGHPNKIIAYELGLSASTVATHLRHALDKLGFSSRIELVALFHQLAASPPAE